jgi:subtilisin-like proprotein convertase family protein
VTWDVANTNVAPVNCQKVNIYGSYTSAIREDDPNLVPLAINVDNDGSQEVFIPNKLTTFFRVIVKAADNIFLTSSIAPSKIIEPTTPTVFFDAPAAIKVCQPQDGVASIKAIGFGGLTGDIQMSILSGVPAGVAATFAKNILAPGETTTLTINSAGLVGSTTLDIILRAIAPGVDTIDRAITVQYVGGNINNIKILTPADGTETSALPRFTWEKKVDASNYNLEISKDPNFATLTVNKILADSFSLSPSLLDQGQVYFWRVSGVNECGEGQKGEKRAFITQSFSCYTVESGLQNIIISGAGTPTVELPLNVTNNGTVSDVNVKSIKMDHARTGDIVASLIAPSGKTVLLWSKKCGTSKNVNVGVDDQAPTFFQCPINTGLLYRPEGKLSDFSGESTQGTWKLKIEDLVNNSGGKILELNVEFCATKEVKNPVIEKNIQLLANPNDRHILTNQLLSVSDIDNSADQLTYTVVVAPTSGELFLNGQLIGVGAKFTQADIDNGRLEYKSTATANTTDAFKFVVTDGAGGWISITTFNIDVNEANPTATTDPSLLSSLNIYPNPTSSQLYIVRGDMIKAFDQYEVQDVSGRSIISGKLSNMHQSISLESLDRGLYTISLSNGDRRISKKLIKI